MFDNESVIKSRKNEKGAATIMANKKMLKNRFKSLSLFIPVLILFSYGGRAFSAEYSLAWPSHTSSGKRADTPKDMQAPYEKRQGVIDVAIGVLAIDSPVKEGDELTLTLFKDLSFRVIVENINRASENSIVFSGKIAGSELSSFVLTADSTGFLITLHKPEKNMTYRVTGSMAEKSGEVSEIDKSKMPPMIHLPPRMPGNLENDAN